ncbi:MAG: hypothetical protein MJZ22_01330 [Candidatus Saccharibacteria bacterium]|nr:hypothetical protein [Candidatus Saccharibacteria bacterium]
MVKRRVIFFVGGVIVGALILSWNIYDACKADPRDKDAPIDNSYHDDSSNIDTAGSSATSTGCGTQKFEEVIVGTEKTKFVKTIGGTASLNCCRADHVNCIRWICGSGADFAAAYANGHHGTGFQDDIATTCANSSGTVCWSGRIRTDGKIDVYNDQNITGKNNLANTYTIGQGMIGMSDALQASMNAAANDVGSTTKRLAYWCDDMVPLCEGPDCNVPKEEEVNCGPLPLGGNSTGVISGVRKETTDSYNWDNGGWVWARPGENVRFHDCYYSGLQNLKGRSVTPSNENKGTYTSKGWLQSCPPGTDAGCKTNKIEYETSWSISLPGYTTLKADIDKNKGGWMTNGYNISGIINHTETDSPDAAAKAYHYLSPSSDATYPVSPDDVGKYEGELKQTIVSLFRGGITDINIGSPEGASWSCWPWWRREWHDAEYEWKEINDAPAQYAVCPGDYTETSRSSSVKNGITFYSIKCQKVKTPAHWEYLSGDSTCTASNPWISYSESGHAEHWSGIRVPYNYINYGEALFDDTVIYSGEKTPRVWGYAINAPRWNPLTKGTYATKAPNSQWGLVGYISDDSGGNSGKPGSLGECSSMEYCEVYESGGGTLNPNGNIDGDRLYIGGGIYNLWDVEAGRYFCSTVMVSSASSGSYDNMTEFGDGSWYTAESNCRVISKKPTFQIHGPMYIESGTIEQGRIATKNNVAGAWGFNAYSNGTALEDNPNNTRNFYSWVDQSLTIGRSAMVNNFATGASANVKRNSGATKVGGINSASIKENIFRSRAMQPLTIPTPSTSATNEPLKGVGAVLNESFKSTVVSSIVDTSKNAIVTDKVSNQIVVPSGEKRVIRSSGELTIDANIVYDETELDSIYKVPLTVIYAPNGIKIGPNVTRIDAWIITDKTLNTCYPKDDPCNKSLTINGTVLANKIELNRTYGAGAGKRSSYPAELFNLSSSTYMYAAAAMRKQDAKKLENVYSRELAPRY